MATSNSSIAADARASAAAASSPAGVDSAALTADKGACAGGAVAAEVPDEDATAHSSAVSAPKASRASLSIHEKSIVKSYCEQKIDECKARGEVVPSQDVLRREVLSKFGWQMGRSTLSKIMTMDWKALNVGAHRNPNMKRKRMPLFPDFEADLVQYISMHIAQHEALAAAETATDEMISTGTNSSNHSAGESMTVSGGDGKQHVMPLPSEVNAVRMAALQPPKSRHVLTEAIILEEAQRLKQVHGIKDEQLVLSVGWLARFKHRNGIRLRKASSTSSSSNSNVAQALQKVPIPPPSYGSSHSSAALTGDIFDTSTISPLHPALVEATPLFAVLVGIVTFTVLLMQQGNPPRKQRRHAEPSAAGIAHTLPSSNFGVSSLSTAAGANAMNGDAAPSTSTASGSRLFWDQQRQHTSSSRQHTRRLSI
ncbi:Methyltransferase domain, partial [Globisporangium splendens]